MKLTKQYIIDNGNLIYTSESHNFIVRKYSIEDSVYEYVINKSDNISTMIRVFKKQVMTLSRKHEAVWKIESYI